MYFDSLKCLCGLFYSGLYVFSPTGVDLVGCQIISLLELILKSIRELSLHLSLFIYEILIAELPTLCLDKLPFFKFFYFA